MSAWWIPWAAVVVAVIWLQVRRALHECDRIIADAQSRTETVHDVGPDSLQLLQDTDEFLNGLVASDPALAAGFDQLRAAIRDEQQNGDD